MGTEVEVMDSTIKEQEKVYCEALRQLAFSDANVYYAAVGLFLDPREHPYKEAILYGWFVLHGGLHTLLNNFPELKHYYAQRRTIPLPADVYMLVQVFIAFRHLEGGSETNSGSVNEEERQQRELRYHLRHSDWFRHRFCQVISEN